MKFLLYDVITLNMKNSHGKIWEHNRKIMVPLQILRVCGFKGNNFSNTKKKFERKQPLQVFIHLNVLMKEMRKDVFSAIRKRGGHYFDKLNPHVRMYNKYCIRFSQDTKYKRKILQVLYPIFASKTRRIFRNNLQSQ